MLVTIHVAFFLSFSLSLYYIYIYMHVHRMYVLIFYTIATVCTVATLMFFTKSSVEISILYSSYWITYTWLYMYIVIAT